MPISSTRDAGVELGELGHQRDDVGLRDRLAAPDRQRTVVVGSRAVALGHEQMPRHGPHGAENDRIRDAAEDDLILDHAQACNRPRVRARRTSCRTFPSSTREVPGHYLPAVLPPWRLKVGLALGGRCAGLAHIGVLRALVREGIPIDVITGTSMGAVVGGAYAALGDIGEIERSVRGLLTSAEFQQNARLVPAGDQADPREPPLFRDEPRASRHRLRRLDDAPVVRLRREVRAISFGRILPDVEVSTTPIRFAASAVDLETAEEIVLCHGRLREVAAASAAIPGILPPRRLHGRLLIDGGWVDKIPVLPAFRLGADVVIAVDISADLADAQRFVRGIDIVLRANTIKDTAMTELQRRLADIVIEPAVRKIHWADFESAGFLHRRRGRGRPARRCRRSAICCARSDSAR